MPEMDTLMAQYDVFLTPARGQREPADHQPDRPSGGLPEGGFIDGLPQALMITGRLYDEATVLRVALAYERATKWHTMHPSLQQL